MGGVLGKGAGHPSSPAAARAVRSPRRAPLTSDLPLSLIAPAPPAPFLPHPTRGRNAHMKDIKRSNVLELLSYGFWYKTT